MSVEPTVITSVLHLHRISVEHTVITSVLHLQEIENIECIKG